MSKTAPLEDLSEDDEDVDLEDDENGIPEDSSAPTAPTTEKFDIGLVREFAHLTRRKRDLSAELITVKAEHSKLERRVVAMFGAFGIPDITVDSTKVYETSRIWAHKEGDASTAQIVAALRASGLDDLVTAESYNHMSLSSYLSGLDSAGEELPLPLQGLISPMTAVTLGVRRATKPPSGSKRKAQDAR